jgi:uncharacterized protein (DUF305 family)
MAHHSFISLVALAALWSAACSDRLSTPSSPTSLPTVSAEAGVAPTRSAPAPGQAAQNFEIVFLTGMINHHAMAVEMAEICLQRAVHQQLRNLCQRIVAAQTQEIETMQSWLADWYGLTHEPEMKPGDERMLEKLASLSAAEFEVTFMEMMIKHHMMALREAEQCLRKAWHPELHQLCQNIITTQSAEIAQLQSWLCQWYGRCK